MVALLRGINVGGRGKLPMKALVSLLEGLGLREVRTYVQSGNAVFRAPDGERENLARRIRSEVQRGFGFEPHVLLLEVGRLERIVQDNPFPDAVDEPKSLHVNVLDEVPPAPDLAGMERLRRDSERFELDDRVMYLHAPEGIARSRLAARAENLLGVPMTGRNWRSITRILALAREVDARPQP